MAYWRPMQQRDLADITAVADAVHPDLLEEQDVLEERLRLFPDGCFVLEEEGAVVGYAVAHPIRPSGPPKLNTLLGEIPADALEFYIHDVALLPHLRGSGLARQGIEKLLSVAENYASVVLISVYGTAGFWSRFGFAPSQRVPKETLSAYGEGAIFMEKQAT
ncbi:GNAT family N-acetyltransferase [Geminicoccus harenae]|uniref:GNAT family N-acetyltransferase n=1 Tax=Geminicoccus harenae TaxID=2498453 RepID=UPI00168A6653|nr:GNAT family N-acetyltransferase [Geminicoccus harenae]